MASTTRCSGTMSYIGFLVITSTSLGRFSEFFHKEFLSASVIEISTSPALRCYTFMSNLKLQNSWVTAEQILLHTHRDTHTTVLRLYGLCPGQPGWASTKRNIHPVTPIVIINCPLSVSSIYYDPWYPPCSIHVPHSLFPQSLSKFFFVCLLAWHPPLHTPYIFFTQSLSSLHNTCPHHRNLFRCSAKIMPSNLIHSLNPLLGILSCIFTPHIHLTILISARWSATSFSVMTGQVSHPCNILLHTQPLYNLPLTFNDISILVSNGTNCLNLFHPMWILFSTAASASPATLNMSPK